MQKALKEEQPAGQCGELQKIKRKMQSLWLVIRCIMIRHGALKTRSTFRCRMQISMPGAMTRRLPDGTPSTL